MKKQEAKILFGPWGAPPTRRPTLRELSDQRRSELEKLKSLMPRFRREVERGRS